MCVLLLEEAHLELLLELHSTTSITSCIYIHAIYKSVFNKSGHQYIFFIRINFVFNTHYIKFIIWYIGKIQPP